MVRSFRREFKDSQQNKNESPALERYAKRQEKLMASQQNILAEDGISIGNIKTAMSSSRMQHNSDGYSDSVGLNSITNGETTIVELIQAVADDTWLSPDQIRTLKKIYNESPTVKQSGKMKKEEIMSMVKSEEELAAVAYLPMKTGYINSDGVEEWTHSLINLKKLNKMIMMPLLGGSCCISSLLATLKIKWMVEHIQQEKL